MVNAHFEAAKNEILEKLPMVNALVVVRSSEVLYESYFNGTDPNALTPGYSFTKGVTGLLIGALLEKRELKSLSIRIRDVLPEYFTSEVDGKFDDLTLEHLLTMKSGFDWDERNLDQLDDRINNLDIVLKSVPACRPGEKFNYDDANSHLISRVIDRITGKKVSLLAENYLFGPLGIRAFMWDEDRLGNSIGGYGLSLTPRDMAKIASLYLDSGRFEGRQLVSAEYISESMTTKSPGGFPGLTEYGYNGWVSVENGYPCFYFLGYGGQFAFSIPSLNSVTVITCDDRLSLDEINVPRYLFNRFVISGLTG